jgi:hypothetical protein
MQSNLKRKKMEWKCTNQAQVLITSTIKQKSTIVAVTYLKEKDNEALFTKEIRLLLGNKGKKTQRH